MRSTLLLTPEQVAHELGIGRTRVFALLAEGDIRSVKIGRSRRIPRSELARYIESMLAGSRGPEAA
jgi:excisionase family DNA binding protein